MSLLDGLISDDGQQFAGTALSALGAGLLSGNRFAPIGPGFTQVLANAQKGVPREAWEKLLIANGFTPDEARTYSASEGTAKAALQQRQLAKLNDTSDAPGLDGGGGASPAPRATPAAPAGPAAGASLNGGTTLTGDMGQYARAIQSNESGGRYDIVGPTHPKYGRALGAYQVMESNLPSWSQEALGRVVSPEEFLGSKEIQDAIFAKKFGQAVAKYGNPQDAASVWFTGRPAAEGGNSRDSLGTTGNAYVSKFNSALRGIQASAGGQAPTQVAAGPQAPGAPVSDATAAPSSDVPALGAQEAGFVIPPGADPRVRAQDRALGNPPTSPTEVRGESTQRAYAIKNFEYWAKKLRVAGAAGDLGKGVAEEAKIRLDLAKKYLEPSDAERLADAAGLKGEDRQTALASAIPGNAQTSLQKEYAAYVRQTLQAGEKPMSLLDYDLKIRGASKPEQNTTIKNVVNPIAKGLGDQLLEQRQAANAAAQSIAPIHQARRLLDEGVFTGTGAETKLKLARIGESIGIQNPKVETTDAFGPVIGQQVLANIKVLGANPSNTDRDFAEKMAGGKITLGEASLRRILDINEAAARQRIQIYNKQVDPMVSTADDELKPFAGVLKVQEPENYQRAERAPAGQAGSGQRSPAPAPAAPPPAAIEYLRANPAARDQFDAKYGRGASSRFLGGVL